MHFVNSMPNSFYYIDMFLYEVMCAIGMATIVSSYVSLWGVVFSPGVVLSNHEEYDKNFVENLYVLFPMTILILTLSSDYYYMESSLSKSLDSWVMKTTAHQWYWHYENIYTLASEDSYMLPPSEWKIGEETWQKSSFPVVIPSCISTVNMLTSGDVFHSWSLPTLGQKMDAVPGIVMMLDMGYLLPGSYMGMCSELCGTLHSAMPIEVESTYNLVGSLMLNKI